MERIPGPILTGFPVKCLNSLINDIRNSNLKTLPRLTWDFMLEIHPCHHLLLPHHQFNYKISRVDSLISILIGSLWLGSSALSSIVSVKAYKVGKELGLSWPSVGVKDTMMVHFSVGSKQCDSVLCSEMRENWKERHANQITIFYLEEQTL